MQLRAFLCWNSGEGVCSRGPRVRISCLSCMHVWQSNVHPEALNQRCANLTLTKYNSRVESACLQKV
jgi:hypothetical protein